MSPDLNLKDKLKTLTLVRVAFAVVLLGSAAFVRYNSEAPLDAQPQELLFLLLVVIFALSLAYALMLRHGKGFQRQAAVQTGIDTLIVTAVLALTGGYASLFSFLYLVVIIYSSTLLPRRGTLAMAALCCIQFGILVILNTRGVFAPPDIPEGFMLGAAGWDEVVYKPITLMLGCIVVAILSSFLSEQVLKTRRELRIMEQQVKRVEKMAVVGELAAGLAHEIKNPLASLSGAIQLLREDIRYDPDHDRLMQIILREADRLGSLANNFLLYARTPAGKPQPMELEKAVRETVELFGKRCDPTRRITTTLKAQPGLWVAMDPAHLRQVLWNLLVNAAEAIDGAGEIRVELAATKDKQVCLQISDSGAGIPAEILSSIFDPFFTTKPNGSGLGLPIVHRLLESYGCRLGVESEPAQGATVSVYLTRIDAPPQTTSPVPPETAAGRSRPEVGAAHA
jgi:two-component system sensor histidine kinase PilS (NtrC family)